MYKIIILLELFGYIALSSLTSTNEEIRIVGGEDVDISEVPYQVSVMNRGRHSCGGAIIASDIVVTAAHCVAGSKPKDFKIRVGSSSHKSGGKIYDVEDLEWHPQYSMMKMDYDIAILWLSTPIEFDENIAPIEMFDTDEEIEDDNPTLVTGWGNLKESGGVPATLQKVEVLTINNTLCHKAYAPLYTVTSRMICAGVEKGGKDACQGDSGGPLTFEDRLAGIVSWGVGCARPHYPGVYAKISSLRPWIDSQIIKMRVKHVLRNVNINLFNMLQS